MAKKKPDTYERNVENDWVSRHEYDIDVFEIVDLLKLKYQNLPQNYPTKSNIIKSAEVIEEHFIELLKTKGYNITQRVQLRNFVLPSNFESYHYYIALKILSMDPYKIEPMLSYQKVFFMGNEEFGKNDFLNLVEFITYKIVKEKNYFNENIRLEKIINWVERNRRFELDESFYKSWKLNESELKDVRTIHFYNPTFAENFVQKLQFFFPIEKHKKMLRKLIIEGAEMRALGFIGTGKQLAELFKRLKYNKHLYNKTDKALVKWICDSFCLIEGENLESLDELYIASVFSKYDKEPSESEIILPEVAEYKPHDKRKQTLKS